MSAHRSFLRAYAAFSQLRDERLHAARRSCWPQDRSECALQARHFHHKALRALWRAREVAA